MAGRGNRHCVSCIGTLSLPIGDQLTTLTPRLRPASSARARPPAVRLYDMKWDESGMKVSNRCSIIALVFLYPSCYRYP